MPKRIRITDKLNLLSLFGHYYEIKPGQVYEVKGEGKGEQRYGYLIYTKTGKAIVIYENECEVLN